MINKIKFIIALFILTGYSFCNAQYVTLPDSNFVKWIKSSPSLSTCLVGNKLDTNCAALLNSKALDLTNTHISDLTGIKYFKQLDSLTCYYCSFPTFPLLPSSLRYIQCRWSELTNLNNLPDSLQYLDCGFNIGIIPPSSFPHFLQYLTCDYNSNFITQYTALPPSLLGLSCIVCGLDKLPVLPNSLYYLICSNNSLISLPDLPPYLFYLDCSYNELTSLPAIPSMWKLYINNNNGLACLPELPTMDYIDFEGTAVTCLPNRAQISISIPEIDTMPICDFTFNPNNCTLVASVSTVTVNAFNIYPNPTNDILFISGNFPTGEIDVRDLLGTPLIEQPINSNTRTSSIDISHLAKGIYFVTLYSNNQNITKKIIKD